MVGDADKFRNEDEKHRERVVSKGALESYCFSMKQTIEDENIKFKIPESDRKAVTDKCSETISWMDANQLADKEEFDLMLKKMEALCKPVVTKLYSGSTK